MKIRADLVFSKNINELIGFTDLGDPRLMWNDGTQTLWEHISRM
jgi:hypothetical protein